MPSSQTLLEKTEKAEEVESLINQYKVIGVASLQKVRAAQLQELRRRLEKSAYFLVTKNSSMKRAIDKCQDKPNLKKFKEQLSGSNIFLFTNINPFRLVLLLQKNKVKTTARAGDIAIQDVVIPAGNTGAPPGPIISQFNAIGLRTRIESGSVWINRDTMAAKKGEVITARLAAVLSKLDLKTAEIGLTMKLVYDDGAVVTEEQLRLDLEETKRSIEEAHVWAFNVSLNTIYPLSENIAILIQIAHQEAFKLALNATILSQDTIIVLVKKAHSEMLSLSMRIDMIKGKSESLIQKS